MSMKYDTGTGDLKNWVIEETQFDPATQGKCETIFSQGNGYLGVRAATEEKYIGQTRNMFVAGTFNKFESSEVTELPNCADVTAVEIYIDGKRFHLEQGEVVNYSRTINLRNGELTRKIRWKNGENKLFDLSFKRFVSLSQLHLLATRVDITAVDNDAEITIESGIDGQQTNSGVQHFREGEMRIYDKRYIELLQHTLESKVDFVITCAQSYYLDDKSVDVAPKLYMGRRKVSMNVQQTVQKGQCFTFEKVACIHTSRDKAFDVAGYQLQSLRDKALSDIKQAATNRYESLLAQSCVEWDKRWQQINIDIEGDDYDQLAIRFAHYHLQVFTPMHDARFGIGAKGLSGEGYKGHSFWDTEVFLLPFFIYSMPDVARNLLEYRYNTINGARKKAKDNGYEGAMYPWESALTGEEETPVWGGVDIVTGKSTKIWSGFIEQHITSDIAYAIWQYYQITGDQKFMDDMGYEILFETATFWTSRLQWMEDRKQWGILDVMGPDEYKEHVDNDAFTNYMAAHNIKLAIEYFEQLKRVNPTVFDKLNKQLGLDKSYALWTERVGDIYLPTPREQDMVIPQDDTYLQKKIIDLSKYRNQTHVGSIFHDYSLHQINEIQVCKQADVMVLFLMLEDLFSRDVKIANWNYYEPKTLHDSSLSLSTHSVLASDVGNLDLAYKLFQDAKNIDLGPAMNTSDHGIHAASIGGIWQCVVYGFGGVRMLGGKLRIQPNLPKHWKTLSFPIYWHGERLNVTVKPGKLTIKRPEFKQQPLIIEVAGKDVEVTGSEIELNV